MNKKRPGILFLIALLLLVAVACRQQPVEPSPTANAAAAVTVEATAEATATLQAVAATATSPPPTPPVATPTIPLPATATTAGEEPVATPPPAPDVSVSASLRFAPYQEAPVNLEPAIYHDPIAPDLSNVIVPMALSQAQRDRLAVDGVVVSPGVEKEFFTVYEQARYANVPIFVSSDSLLHSYHLLFDKVLRTAEQERFIPLLQALNQALLAEVDARYQALGGSDWSDDALRAVAFVGVGTRLLDPEADVPAYVQDLVEAELALIEEAGGLRPSPIFPDLPYGEDYSQYIPRGHYTRSEELSRYFRSMMWYGRMTFRLRTDDPEVGRAETRAAVVLLDALRAAQVDGEPAMDAWLDLYNPTVFFVGRSDDLTPLQYLAVMDAVYGEAPTLEQLTDEGRLDLFIEAAEQLPPPQILGMVIDINMDVEEATKGFRFMGQRFVPDAFIFRQLIWRNVGTLAEPRQLPKGLDIMAALGSERAYAILEELGETEYENYPAQMAKVREWMAAYPDEAWTETLYNTWLYTFQPLLEEPAEGYPQFMQSQAWQDKQLNTALGSWAELKHDTILYAKQVYAEMGGGGSNAPQPVLARGYVEPVPVFFARIGALARMTRQGLGERGLLGEQDANSLQRIEDLAASFQLMAEKELRGEPLTEEEYYLIRFYGGELENLVMASADSDEEGGIPVMDEEPQAAVIADVATAPDPALVLEEAVGRIDELYAVVPLIEEDGTITLQVAKGGVFSYYEFPWPMGDRLTDEAWRQMLDAGEAPERPAWIDSFFSLQTEQSTYQQAIYSFQRNLSPAYWNLTTEWLSAGEAAVSQIQQRLDALAGDSQYVGHQWINTSYRSFDRQAEDRVVVTVRETWDDTLYNFREQPGDSDQEREVVGRRGPYALDVTYTLERSEGDSWQVSNVVYANEPPAWEPATE